MRRRWLATALAAAAIVRPSAAHGQNGDAVLLRIAPRIGDTIRTRLDQSTEMVASARLPGEDTVVTVRSWMATQAQLRQVVEATDARGSMLRITIDSVVLKGEGVPLPSEEQRRVLQGQAITVHLAPDGTVEMIEGDDALAADLRSAFSNMPATLPVEAVKVGGRWTKAMTIPIYGEGVARPGARVDAEFRLDSLAARGTTAFISMRGTITREGRRGEDKDSDRTMLGTMQGTMVVDRARGWIVDSRTTVQVKSETPPSMDGGGPLRFQLRMTQRMRTLPPAPAAP